jgi:hypothetical protein
MSSASCAPVARVASEGIVERAARDAVDRHAQRPVEDDRVAGGSSVSAATVRRRKRRQHERER